MQLIFGIDDTDNHWSRGTGFRVRQLASRLASYGFANVLHITRHQLLVDPRIPYTSHNSTTSMVIEPIKTAEEIISYCGKFLFWKSALFSDTGFCVINTAAVDDEIKKWGRRAKSEILTMKEARMLAEKKNFILQGLRGRKTGIIGALAATGLGSTANDGRLLWLKGLREIKGVINASLLKKSLKIDKIADLNDIEIRPEDSINTDGWCRPVWKNGQITLIVEEVKNNELYQWQLAPKDFIKAASE